jgi:hypothetical protein
MTSSPESLFPPIPVPSFPALTSEAEARMVQFFHWKSALLSSSGQPYRFLGASPVLLDSNHVEPADVLNGMLAHLGAAYAFTYVLQRILFRRDDKQPVAAKRFKRAIPDDSDTSSMPYAQLTLPQLVLMVDAKFYSKVYEDIRLQVLRLQTKTVSPLATTLAEALRSYHQFLDANKDALPLDDTRLCGMAAFLEGWNRVIEGYVLGHRHHEKTVTGVAFPTLSTPNSVLARIGSSFLLADLSEGEDGLALRKALLDHECYRLSPSSGIKPPDTNVLHSLRSKGFLDPWASNLADAKSTLSITQHILQHLDEHNLNKAGSASPEAWRQQLDQEEAELAALREAVAIDAAAPNPYGPWGNATLLELGRHLARGVLYGSGKGYFMHLGYKPAQEALAKADLPASVHHDNMFLHLQMVGLIRTKEVLMGSKRRLYGVWTPAGEAALREFDVPRHDPPIFQEEHLHPVFQAYKAAKALFEVLAQHRLVMKGEGILQGGLVWYDLRHVVGLAKAGSEKTRKDRLKTLVNEGLVKLDAKGRMFAFATAEALTLADHLAPPPKVIEAEEVPAPMEEVPAPVVAEEPPAKKVNPLLEVQEDGKCMGRHIHDGTPEGLAFMKKMWDPVLKSEDTPEAEEPEQAPELEQVQEEEPITKEEEPITKEEVLKRMENLPKEAREQLLTDLLSSVHSLIRYSKEKEKVVRELVTGGMRALEHLPDPSSESRFSRGKFKDGAVFATAEELAALTHLSLVDLLKYGAHVGRDYAVSMSFSTFGGPPLPYAPRRLCFMYKAYRVQPPSDR